MFQHGPPAEGLHVYWSECKRTTQLQPQRMGDAPLCSNPVHMLPWMCCTIHAACNPSPLFKTHTPPLTLSCLLSAAVCACVLGTPMRQGRNVVLESKYGSPKIVNDGVTIAREVELEDPVENIGAKLVRQAAARTNDTAGDGTTTATILSAAFIAEGLKIVAAGEAAAAAVGGGGGRGSSSGSRCRCRRRRRRRQHAWAQLWGDGRRSKIISRCRKAGRQGGGNWPQRVWCRA